MICLTGDVHHMSLKTKDQKYLKGSEIDSSIKYLQIAEEYDLNVTLFITGKCFQEELEGVHRLTKLKNLEIGGHNYYAYKPRLPFRILKKITGLQNGPHFFQSWEVEKTVKIIENTTGIRIRSWRNHGYRNDRNTIDILVEKGIHYYSDQLSADTHFPYEEKGITIFPINVLPDHDYIFHGYQTIETVNQAKLIATPFACKAMSVNQWLDAVKRQVEKITGNGGVATLLVHPACMEIIDNMQCFRKLCKYLSQYKSCKMKDWVNITSHHTKKEETA